MLTALEKLKNRDSDGEYRLPTAVEWEYAARAGRKTEYFFGAEQSELHRYGNCRNLLSNDGREGPAPLGSYEPNPWGLYDVHRNVAEWVQWPDDAGPQVNDKGQEQALRLGGSFDNAPVSCTFGGSRSSVNADVENRNDTGFRVARDLNAEEDRE